MPFVPLAETSTEAADVREPDRDRLTMTDTTGPVEEIVAMMTIGFETEARAEIVTLDGNAHPAQSGPRANHLHHSQQKMNVIGELFSCNNLLLD